MEVAPIYQGKTFDFNSSSKPNVDEKTELFYVRQFLIQCNCLFDQTSTNDFFLLYTVVTYGVKFYYILDLVRIGITQCVSIAFLVVDVCFFVSSLDLSCLYYFLSLMHGSNLLTKVESIVM